MNRKKQADPRRPIVYSTDPSFSYPDHHEAAKTPPPSEQTLRVRLDNKHRKGKTVTLVEGFIGKNEDLESLGKVLKTQCGTGGTAKDGQILVQGDYAERVRTILGKMGYVIK